MKRIIGLDVLRAFAVFFVIKQHWGPAFDRTMPFMNFVQTVFIPMGNEGVFLFFTLSGFLITSILLDARIKNNDTNRGEILKIFFFRRILRIFPLYYLMVFILFWFFPDIKETIGYLITYSLNMHLRKINSFSSSFLQSWTLDIEEQFYFLWPWLILFINRKYLKYVFISAIAIGIISTYISLNVKHKVLPFLMTDCIDALAIGGLYAYVRFDENMCKNFEKAIKRLAPLFLFLYFYWHFAWYLGYPQYGRFLEKTDESFICIWLISLIIHNKSEKTRKYLLENRFLNFTGKISYGIYIIHPYLNGFHDNIEQFLKKRLLFFTWLSNIYSNFYFLYIIDLTMLFIVCWLSYTFIETPILKLKSRFKYNND